MSKKINIDKLIEKIWLLAVALVVISLLVTWERFGLKCITDVVEQKLYYQEFLWPALYNSVSKLTLGVVVAATAIHLNTYMEIGLDDKERDISVIRTIAYITTSIALLGFILFNVIYMKAYSCWMIHFAVVICIGFGATVRAIKKYKKANVDDESEDLASDGNKVCELWEPVIKRLNVMLIAVLFFVALFFSGFRVKVENAQMSYDELTSDVVRIGFGHKHSMERNRTIVQLQFVNLYNKAGRQYSMEVLEEEYANYLNGNGTWSNLWQFCHDSIEIELDWDNEKTTYISKPYWVDAQADGPMAEYYLGEKSKYNEDDYNDLKIDKFLDLASFYKAVEAELNEKGLTLHQSNDSTADDRKYNHDLWMKYKSASADEVYAACEAVANGKIEQ